jgi:hypothetical protein
VVCKGNEWHKQIFFFTVCIFNNSRFYFYVPEESLCLVLAHLWDERKNPHGDTPTLLSTFLSKVEYFMQTRVHITVIAAKLIVRSGNSQNCDDNTKCDCPILAGFTEFIWTRLELNIA